MNNEMQPLIDGLKAKFDLRVLELAGLINIVSRSIPPGQVGLLNSFALCVRARIHELELDPHEVVRAVDEVARAQHTAALIQVQDFSEPTQLDEPTKSLLAKFRI